MRVITLEVSPALPDCRLPDITASGRVATGQVKLVTSIRLHLTGLLLHGCPSIDVDVCNFRRLFFISHAHPCPREYALLPLILAFLPLSLVWGREVFATKHECGL